MEIIISAFPAVLSAATLAVLSFVARRVFKLSSQWDVMRTAQRNQLKASIVALYEKAIERGNITPMELESLNRMADSYFALGGNNYIHAVVKRANAELDIDGEPIPY